MGKLVESTVEDIRKINGDDAEYQEVLAMVSSDQNRVGLILGTGWGDPTVIEHYVEVEQELDFFDCGIEVAGRIEGHAGKFIFGTWGNVPVVISSGRVHFNQTHDDRTLLRDWMGILLAFMGKGRRLIVTQAVGGLVQNLPVGMLAIPTTTVVAHLQPTYLYPGEFVTPEAELPREESSLLGIALDAADKADIRCMVRAHYHMVCGPFFGGKGDRMDLKARGFHTVGMSLIPELALVALENSSRKEEEGICVAPVQFVTDNQDVPTHEDNQRKIREAAPKLGAFLNEIIHAEW